MSLAACMAGTDAYKNAMRFLVRRPPRASLRGLPTWSAATPTKTRCVFLLGVALHANGAEVRVTRML